MFASLDKFKNVGDPVAKSELVHIGLPWADVRVMFGVWMFPLEQLHAVRFCLLYSRRTVSGSRRMDALLTGVALFRYMGNWLQVYFVSAQRLPSILATDNFESGLIKMYTHEPRFAALVTEAYRNRRGMRT